MSNDNTTPVVENAILEQGTPVVPVAKTKKELKKERKEIKKHKKQVKKEAKLHSAKTTKIYNVLVTVISIVVIVSMIFCSINAIQIARNVSNAPSAEAGEQVDGDNSATPSTPSTPSIPSTPSTPAGDADADSDAAGDSNSEDTNAPAGDNSAEDTTVAGDNSSADSNAVAGDLSTKEGVVEYFKTAHAKVLSSAKSVTRTYDNTVNFEEYLEVGGNSTLAGVAKQLMGMFMKENTEQLQYTGADIATNFPPTKNSCEGLTADIIGDYSCTEDGNNYIIKLSIDSSKENPDLGEKSAHLVSIVESKTVEDAAAGFVSFEGLENRYFAPTVTATIDKATGNMTALEVDTPSHMCFAKATVAFVVNVNNVGIGLEFLQKWTIEW